MSRSIVFYFRKPFKVGNYSIEGLFNSLYTSLVEDPCVKIEKSILPFRKLNLFYVFLNILYSIKDFNKTILITGDVNYLAIFRTSKTILVIHDFDTFKNSQSNRIKNKLYKFLWFDLPLWRAHRIVTVSKFTNIQLESLYPKYHKKSLIIDNFIRDSFLNCKIKPISAPEKFVLFIGHTKNKNFINAYKSLRAYSDIFLVCIGKKSNFKNEAKNHSVELNNVIFYTNISEGELKFLYKNTQFLFFPSLYEGFGLPIIEAQAMKCPVVTSRIEPITTVSGGDSSCILVNPHCINDMTKGVVAALNNKSKESILSNGLKNAKTFTKLNVLKKYKKLIEECVE